MLRSLLAWTSFAVAAGIAQEPPVAAPATAPAAAPELVTAKTRASAAEMARLTKPGKQLFADDFESERSFAQYFEVRGRPEGHARIAHEPDRVHGGSGSLELTSPAADGRSSGAGLDRWLGDEGHDVVHLRYWIRYATEYDQGNLHHTGGTLCGVAGTDKWRGMGSAGQRPRGDDHFSSRVEGWRDWQRVDAPGFLHCYTYWMEMQRDRDGNYWGNMLGPVPEQRFVPARGKWLCVEQRVACNTPGQADGELAVWLDGELYVHYRGMRWRDSAELRIKRIGLLVYVHAATRANTVWFDDVVVSTGYIGTGVAADAKGKVTLGAGARQNAPMMRLGILVSFVLSGGCSFTVNLVRIGDDGGAIAAALDQAWQRHFTAARAKDAAAASALYTDDALYAVAGQPALRGRAAIEAMEKVGMQTTEVGIVGHDTQALRVDGTVAHEIGTVSGDVAAGGAPATTVVFDYVAAWRRDADGCWRIAHLVGHFAGAATAGTAAPTATACDLRPQFEALGLTPRAQGHRPTCSIFTTVAVLEYAFARATGTSVRLSVEYCNWAANAATGRRDDGDFFHCALAGFERFGICRDELWPYGKAFAADAAPSPDALVDGGRHVAAAAGLRVRWIRPIGGGAGLSPAQFDDLLATLRAGWPVAAGSAHSRVLVGYRADAAATGGGTFLTLDSGVGGFAEVTAAYVREQINDAFVVEAAERP